MEDKHTIINNYDLTRVYLQKMKQHTKSTLDILHNENYNVEVTYQMSTVFLSSLESVYLKYTEHQYKNELFSTVFASLPRAYDDYVFQLQKAIDSKEDNLTWLQSEHDQLLEEIESIIESLNIQIKELQKRL